MDLVYYTAEDKEDEMNSQNLQAHGAACYALRVSARMRATGRIPAPGPVFSGVQSSFLNGEQ